MTRNDSRVGDALLLLIASVVALVLVRRDLDPDIFGRIAYARDAYAQGAWTWQTDPYSYTVPGGPWMDHEWGFSWIAFAVYKLGGWSAVRFLRIVLMAATGWIALLAVRRMPGAPRVLPMFALALAPVFALAFIGPRPQAFSYLFFAWMLVAFARAGDATPRWLLWAVLPMPIWVNVHGGFLAGMGVAVLWMLCRVPGFVRGRDHQAITWTGIAVTWCAVSALLQPWGWDYVVRIAEAGTMARPFVQEWNPPQFLGVHWVLAALFVVLAGVAVKLGWRRWPDLAVVGALAIESFLHRRHLTFFAIAVAVFAFPVIVARWHQRRSAVRGRRGVSVAMTVSAGVAAALVLFTVAGKVRGPAPHEPEWPTAAVQFLKTQSRGGVLADFEWGEYVIFAAAPGITVAVDGRYEEVYPDDLMKKYVAWHFGFDGWRALPDDPATRYALVATRSTRATRLSSLAPEWQRVYADSTATVFAKGP